MLKTCRCYNGMDENETILDYSRRKLIKVPQEVLVRGRASIEELYLDSNSIEILPKELFNISKLRILSVSDNNVSKLSSQIGNLDNLENLDVSKNCIASFPDSIVRCTQLAQLDGSVNPIVKLSDGLISLSSLTHLVLNETFLDCLPENFGRLSKLKVLELRHNHLHTLPKSMCNLKELERLDIGENKFLHLPVAIGHLINLQELLADGNMIEEIPPVIGLLRNLIFLELSKNKLESLPPEMEELHNLTAMYLSVNELLELPENIGSLCSLQTLKLDENDLIFLPSSIGRLHLLEELDVTTNNLEGLPCTVGQLTMLRILTLDNNCIKSLPAELGNCTSLSLLSLHSNELITIPETLGSLQNLQMINLSGNMLSSLPLSFLYLKNLKALWLSENQSKAFVPLQRKYNEDERKYVVTCYLLPQQSWDNDEIQQRDRESGDDTTISSIVEDKEYIIDGKESQVRTRGSISESLISGNAKDEGDEEGQLKPWYEQEFIESVGNSDCSPDHEELNGKSLSTEGSHNLSRGNTSLQESFQSRFSFKEEIPSSMSQLSNMTSLLCTTPPCCENQPGNVTSSESTETDRAMFSFLKRPSTAPSLLSSSPVVSSDAGAVVLSRELLSHNERKSLAYADGDINTGGVYGNTSSSILDQPDKTEGGNGFIDSLELVPPDNNNMLRLRFGYKRHRDGNPICQYEAFKPTRFNLYQECNDVSLALAAKDLPDASPMLKKKSVTSKDNPLIGTRLLRDESPPARPGDYTTNPKFEEKIRVLQQQKLKERSRRRNNSARVEYRGEQQREFSKLSPVSPPPYVVNDSDCSDPNKLPVRPPPYYLIADEGDSVAIKLGDFVLVSPKEAVDNRRNDPAQIYETAGRIRDDESSTPANANRFNGFAEQQQKHSAAHYFNNNNNVYQKRSHSDVLQAAHVLPDEARQSKLHGRVVTSSTNASKVTEQRVEEETRNRRYHKPDNATAADVEQKGDLNQSNRSDHRPVLLENCGASIAAPGQDSETESAANSGNSSNYSRYQTQGVTPRSDFSSCTTVRECPVLLLPPKDAAVQHITVKSSKIDQPVSPRIIMAVDGRSQDVTFKEFLPSCAVEDVTSFLVNNLSDLTSKKSNQGNVDSATHVEYLKTDCDHRSDCTSASSQFMQEHVSVDCDVEEVTRNISQHLPGFSKVSESAKDITGDGSKIKVQVTDLDMPDAACPLSRNLQHDGKCEEYAKEGKHKNFQVISLPSGEKEEVHVRVYRSPILGFSIGGGVETETNDNVEGIYVVDVKPNGPSSHLLKLGDRILEVNNLNLRSVSHDHALLFLTYNQQLDLLIERVRHE